MSITYLRNRAREMRHARTETEYQESLEKLVRYLSLISPEENLTTMHKQKALTHLRQLGINATRVTYRR